MRRLWTNITHGEWRLLAFITGNWVFFVINVSIYHSWAGKLHPLFQRKSLFNSSSFVTIIVILRKSLFDSWNCGFHTFNLLKYMYLMKNMKNRRIHMICPIKSWTNPHDLSMDDVPTTSIKTGGLFMVCCILYFSACTFSGVFLSTNTHPFPK